MFRIPRTFKSHASVRQVRWRTLALIFVFLASSSAVDAKVPLTTEQIQVQMDEQLAVVEQSSDSVERAEALKTLYWLLRSAGDENRQYRNKLVRLLSDGDDSAEVKFVLAYVLVSMGEHAGVPVLASFLREGSCAHVQPEIVPMLDPQASLTDICEQLRFATVGLFRGVRDDPEIRQSLRHTIEHDKSPWVRASALAILRNTGYRNAFVQELAEEDDSGRQLQLVRDLMATSKTMRSEGSEAAPLRFYPIQAH